ncbi:MAG TPA: flagellar basal body rod protein FlgB [Gammaproteobacteria bacterium]|nr:flagellar basal body rod protein FlgB [Gammaproteobacteria bacterium]
MSQFWHQALGIHEQALNLFGRRARILASNLANAETPNYKARDIDFRQALTQASASAVPMSRTHAGHMDVMEGAGSKAVLYRQPTQASLDGNTVEPHVEKAEFLQNAIRYQASLQFLSNRFKGLKLAIRGE